MADTFRNHVLNNNKSDSQVMPVVTLGSCSFLYMREARRMSLPSPVTKLVILVPFGT